jgi:hypothetical protein
VEADDGGEQRDIADRECFEPAALDTAQFGAGHARRGRHGPLAQAMAQSGLAQLVAERHTEPIAASRTAVECSVCGSHADIVRLGTIRAVSRRLRAAYQGRDQLAFPATNERGRLGLSAPLYWADPCRARMKLAPNRRIRSRGERSGLM